MRTSPLISGVKILQYITNSGVTNVYLNVFNTLKNIYFFDIDSSI